MVIYFYLSLLSNIMSKSFDWSYSVKCLCNYCRSPDDLFKWKQQGVAAKNKEVMMFYVALQAIE